jgi:HEXXH motif-containing protein
MLIHEATHQYFHLLARYGALDDGTGEMYFSPIKGTERPVNMILLAYHAFGNVLLFYRLCRRKRLKDAGYCRKNELQLLPQLRKLEEALVHTNALTPLGEALWRPLAVRLW